MAAAAGAVRKQTFGEVVLGRARKIGHFFSSSKEAEKFRKRCEDSDYSCQRLIPHLYRITGGHGMQMHLLLTVYQMTKNRGLPEGSCKYTVRPMQVSDLMETAGGETAVGRQAVSDALAALLRTGLMSSLAIDQGGVDQEKAKWSPFALKPDYKGDPNDLYILRTHWEGFKDAPTVKPQHKPMGTADEAAADDESADEAQGVHPQLAWGFTKVRRLRAGKPTLCGGIKFNGAGFKFAVQTNHPAVDFQAHSTNQKDTILLTVDIAAGKIEQIRPQPKPFPTAAATEEAGPIAAPQTILPVEPPSKPWPQAIAYVRGRFPSTPKPFCAELFSDCAARVERAGLDRALLTSEVLIECMGGCSMRGQATANFWKSGDRLADTVEDWAEHRKRLESIEPPKTEPEPEPTSVLERMRRRRRNSA